MSDLENMIEAVKQGDRESVRAILESDDRLANQRDESGATPLHYATLNGHRQIVQLLLERGADINSTDSQFGATPAGWAIEYLREMGGYLAIELDDLALRHSVRGHPVGCAIPEAVSFASSSERHKWNTVSAACPRIGQRKDCGAIRIGGCSIRTARDGRCFGHARGKKGTAWGSHPWTLPGRHVARDPGFRTSSADYPKSDAADPSIRRQSATTPSDLAIPPNTEWIGTPARVQTAPTKSEKHHVSGTHCRASGLVFGRHMATSGNRRLLVPAICSNRMQLTDSHSRK